MAKFKVHSTKVGHDITQHFVKVFPPYWTAIPITVNLKWQIPNDVWRKPSPSVTKSKFKVTPYYYYFIIFSTSVLVECSNLIILHRPWPEPLQHFWEEEECKIRASTSHPTAVPDLFWLNGQKNSHWHAAKPSGNGFQKAAAKGFGVRCPKSSQSGVYFIFFFFRTEPLHSTLGWIRPNCVFILMLHCVHMARLQKPSQVMICLVLQPGSNIVFIHSDWKSPCVFSAVDLQVSATNSKTDL